MFVEDKGQGKYFENPLLRVYFWYCQTLQQKLQKIYKNNTVLFVSIGSFGT